jgi:hypothetical protein
VANVETTDSVAEAAVVGINDELTGQAVNAFVALKDGTESSEQVKKDLILQVRKSIGPFAAPKAIFVVPDLPKTRSGKIMRRIMRKILAGEEDQLGDITTVSAGFSCGGRVVTRCCGLKTVLTELGAALGSVGGGEDYRHCAPGQAQEIEVAAGLVGRVPAHGTRGLAEERRAERGWCWRLPTGVWLAGGFLVRPVFGTTMMRLLCCIVAGPGWGMAILGILANVVHEDTDTSPPPWPLRGPLGPPSPLASPLAARGWARRPTTKERRLGHGDDDVPLQPRRA